MLILWVTFFLYVAFMFVIKLILGGTYMNAVAIFAIVMHIPLAFAGIYNSCKEYARIVFAGYIMRLIVAFWDVFGRGVFLLPHAGMDDHGYLWSAIDIGNDLTLIGERIYGGVYSKTVGIILYFSGGGEFMVRYINVLFGISIVLLMYKCLLMLDIKEAIRKKIIIIVAFFPQAIIFSGITLRENLIAFIIALSIYFFTRWHVYGGLFSMLMSVACICWASVYHSGCIFILTGYMFAQMFYQRENDRFVFRFKTIMLFIIFFLLSSTIYTEWSDIFLAKFPEYNEEMVFNRAAYATGGSAYLQGVEVNSMSTFIMFAPLKMIYFIASPVPWNWRGVMDIITFSIDSLFYIVTACIVVWNVKVTKKKYPIIVGICIALLASVFIFGIGSGNSGTAIRHRHKLVPLFLVALACTLQQRTDNNSLEERKQHES